MKHVRGVTWLVLVAAIALSLSGLAELVDKQVAYPMSQAFMGVCFVLVGADQLKANKPSGKRLCILGTLILGLSLLSLISLLLQ